MPRGRYAGMDPFNQNAPPPPEPRRRTLFDEWMSEDGDDDEDDGGGGVGGRGGGSGGICNGTGSSGSLGVTASERRLGRNGASGSTLPNPSDPYALAASIVGEGNLLRVGFAPGASATEKVCF